MLISIKRGEIIIGDCSTYYVMPLGRPVYLEGLRKESRHIFFDTYILSVVLPEGRENSPEMKRFHIVILVYRWEHAVRISHYVKIILVSNFNNQVFFWTAG